MSCSGEMTRSARLDSRMSLSDSEIVLTTRDNYAPTWLVSNADDAARVFVEAGGREIVEPFDVPVGRLAIVADPFDNVLVLLDLSKGRYVTDDARRVTGVARESP